MIKFESKWRFREFIYWMIGTDIIFGAIIFWGGNNPNRFFMLLVLLGLSLIIFFVYIGKLIITDKEVRLIYFPGLLKWRYSFEKIDKVHLFHSTSGKMIEVFLKGGKKKYMNLSITPDEIREAETIFLKMGVKVVRGPYSQADHKK